MLVHLKAHPHFVGLADKSVRVEVRVQGAKVLLGMFDVVLHVRRLVPALPGAL